MESVMKIMILVEPLDNRYVYNNDSNDVPSSHIGFAQEFFSFQLL